jgi:hypothetical protein
MKEKLQQYALVAEIVGGIAIVASLVFVGLEIRQNSRVSQVNAYQELIAQITLINTMRIEDAEFAELFWRFDHGEQPNDNGERARIEAFMMMVIRHADLAWRQYDVGLISRGDLISVLAPLRAFLNTQMGQEVWGVLAISLDPAFVSFVTEVGLHCGSYTGTGSYCD